MNGQGDAVYKGFWTINIGHLLVIVPMLVALIGYFSTDHQVLVSLVAAQESLSRRVESINSNGTQFSQRGVSRDNDLVVLNAQRISALERSMTDNVTSSADAKAQLAGIAADVNWIKEWVKRQTGR